MSDKLIPMGRENPKDDFAVVYMCRTAFECELGMASGGNRVFPSEEDCRENSKCADACGIVEVEVRFRRIVHEGTDPAYPARVSFSCGSTRSVIVCPVFAPERPAGSDPGRQV